MSGRGKGGKGLGKGGAKRHRKVLRDNIQVRGTYDRHVQRTIDGSKLQPSYLQLLLVKTLLMPLAACSKLVTLC